MYLFIYNSIIRFRNARDQIRQHESRGSEEDRALPVDGGAASRHQDQEDLLQGRDGQVQGPQPLQQESTQRLRGSQHPGWLKLLDAQNQNNKNMT